MIDKANLIKDIKNNMTVKEIAKNQKKRKI